MTDALKFSHGANRAGLWSQSAKNAWIQRALGCRHV